MWGRKVYFVGSLQEIIFTKINYEIPTVHQFADLCGGLVKRL